MDNGPEVSGAVLCGLVRGPRHGDPSPSTWQTRSERLLERFNRTYRTEVLNAHLFESLDELQALTDTWSRVYNEERPHDGLSRVPPLTFLPRPRPVAASPFECLLDGEAYDSPLSYVVRNILRNRVRRY